MSNQIGEQNTSLMISFTTKNTLKNSSKVVVYFPAWSFVDTIADTHQIQATNPTCSNVEGMN